ncbi:MAG: guanylate kinase [Clostridia bacterium]|nr:guanylate kinase [Clostridia bacterium]
MARKKKGLLIVVSGPAGVGKGTVNAALMQKHPEIRMSVSVTTRAPRPGEIEGVHYFFRTKEEFDRMIEEDAFLEYMHVFGMNYYGTPKAFVETERNKGNHVILEIDVQGALKVKSRCPDAVLVFIAPPSLKVLKDRLVGRGTETQESIDVRTATALEELKKLPDYDYMVINDVVEEAVADMEAILSAELNRTARNQTLITKLTGGETI